MLEEQARLVDDVEALAVALLERDRLLDRQPDLAGDEIDLAGEQVGFHRGGVLDRPHHDPLEGGFSPHHVGFCSSTT